MNISFNGFNKKLATFEIAGQMYKGDVVKMTDNYKVSPCSSGDDFCGTLVSKENDNCGAIQLTGATTVIYSGTAPSVGYCNLVADGNCGVKVSSTGGQPHLIVSVDTTLKLAEILL